MNVVGIPPQIVPLVDSNGRIRVEWYRFFAGVESRLGGATGPGTMDLDSASFAPLQPAIGEAAFSDIVQQAQSIEAVGDVMQSDSAGCFDADVYQS